MKLFRLFVFLATATWVLADVPESVPEATGTNIFDSHYTVESIGVHGRGLPPQRVSYPGIGAPGQSQIKCGCAWPSVGEDYPG